MADRQHSGHWGFDPGGFFHRLPKRVMSIALLTLQTSWIRNTFGRRGVFHDTVRSFVLTLEGQPFATVRVDDRATVWRGRTSTGPLRDHPVTNGRWTRHSPHSLPTRQGRSHAIG